METVENCYTRKSNETEKFAVKGGPVEGRRKLVKNTDILKQTADTNRDRGEQKDKKHLSFFCHLLQQNVMSASIVC